VALFLVLHDYQDTARKLPAGALIDDAQYDLTALRASGIAAVAFDEPTMGTARTRFLQQQATEHGRPNLMTLILLSNGGAAAVGTSTGQTVEQRL
jgi:hypothetical protein